MNHPEFGIKNVIPANATACWGARGILKYGTVDIPRDRQGMEGEDKAPLALWLDAVGMDWVDDTGPKLKADSPEVKALDCGPYHIRISTQASYGHVYITAWMDKS